MRHKANPVLSGIHSQRAKFSAFVGFNTGFTGTATTVDDTPLRVPQAVEGLHKWTLDVICRLPVRGKNASGNRAGWNHLKDGIPNLLPFTNRIGVTGDF